MELAGPMYREWVKGSNIARVKPKAASIEFYDTKFRGVTCWVNGISSLVSFGIGRAEASICCQNHMNVVSILGGYSIECLKSYSSLLLFSESTTRFPKR